MNDIRSPTLIATRYQIREWDKNFESASSRKLEHPQWLSVPNKQHGMGLKRLLMEPDGAAVFGIWVLIIEACSRHRKPRRGYLTEDGTKDGIPWTATDLALQWSRPAPEIERALAVLTGRKIGWIEAVENSGDTEKSATHPPMVAQSSATEVADEWRTRRGGSQARQAGESGKAGRQAARAREADDAAAAAPEGDRTEDGDTPAPDPRLAIAKAAGALMADPQTAEVLDDQWTDAFGDLTDDQVDTVFANGKRLTGHAIRYPSGFTKALEALRSERREAHARIDQFEAQREADRRKARALEDDDLKARRCRQILDEVEAWLQGEGSAALAVIVGDPEQAKHLESARKSGGRCLGLYKLGKVHPEIAKVIRP